MKRNLAVLFFAATASVAIVAQTGCSSTLAQPFESKKQEPITVFRLQNFEPQPQAAAGGAMQLPPQIQQWIQGAAAALPPGLIPPGLLPGAAPAQTANVQRYYNFPILGTAQVVDKKTHEEILELFADSSNFEAPTQSCMYAEFGFQIGQPAPQGVQGAPTTSAPADILVSLSCDQVQMFNYGWPHGSKTGLTANASKKIIAIVQKTFGG